MSSKKEKKKKTHIPFRLNVLFFCVFLMFSTIIVKLGMVQIVHGEDYRNEVEQKENSTVSTPVPRGEMEDRNHNVVVDNKPIRTITYTRMKGSTSEDRLETAEQLAGLIEVPTDTLTERDKKDYWMLLNEERAQEKITKQDKADLKSGKIDEEELAKRQRDRITEEELNELTPHDLEVLAIKSKMDSGYSATPQIIKKDATPEEYAVVSENLAQLPGVDTTVDWDRQYPYDQMLRTVLGGVTSAEEGLPQENLDYYLVRDYDRNDRVGKSYIEQEYDDVLHGTEAEVKNVTDEEGNILDTIYLSKGQSGDNLTLTIDMELQKRVEEILEKELLAAKPNSPYLDRAFVVMMNPKSGEVLSMAGKQLVNEDGEMKVKDYALGTMTSSYEMGSVVKGATVLAGYETGAISPGTIINDQPMYFKNGQKKSSWTTMGPIDDLTALQRSSNVYMFNTALRMAGVPYVPYGTLAGVESEDYERMRYYYSQFGLGVPTGIDLPNEVAGYKGQQNPNEPGKLLDLAIGQFDTYTPLQLAQYVSTIANGGYRMQPQVVKEITEPTTNPNEPGKVVHSMEPVVLNRVDMDPEYISRVQEGFKMVFQTPNGTGYHNGFQGATYDPAGKTGTAQATYAGPDKSAREKNGGKPPTTYNLTLVGYAPASDPEIAFSVVVPWVSSDKDPVNKRIGREIMDAYFELKEERANGGTEQAATNEGTTNEATTEE